MKGLSFVDKLIFCINSILAFVLLLSYVLPYIPPRHFALLSVLVLSVPFLIIANALFVIYWILKFKKTVFVIPNYFRVRLYLHTFLLKF